MRSRIYREPPRRAELFVATLLAGSLGCSAATATVRDGSQAAGEHSATEAPPLPEAAQELFAAYADAMRETQDWDNCRYATPAASVQSAPLFRPLLVEQEEGTLRAIRTGECAVPKEGALGAELRPFVVVVEIPQCAEEDAKKTRHWAAQLQLDYAQRGEKGLQLTGLVRAVLHQGQLHALHMLMDPWWSLLTTTDRVCEGWGRLRDNGRRRAYRFNLDQQAIEVRDEWFDPFRTPTDTPSATDSCSALGSWDWAEATAARPAHDAPTSIPLIITESAEAWSEQLLCKAPTSMMAIEKRASSESPKPSWFTHVVALNKQGYWQLHTEDERDVIPLSTCSGGQAGLLMTWLHGGQSPTEVAQCQDRATEWLDTVTDSLGNFLSPEWTQQIVHLWCVTGWAFEDWYRTANPRESGAQGPGEAVASEGG